MKRIILIIIACFALSSLAHGQQYIQQSQFFNNLQGINPAYSGWKNSIEVRSGYRKEWANFEGSPESYFMTFHIPINNPDEPKFTNYSLRMSDPELYREMVKEYLKEKTKIKYGLGAYLLNENRSLFTKTSAALTYSIHWALGEKMHISAGVSTGFNNFRFNKDKVTVSDPEDPLYQEFQNNPNAKNGFDVNAGILLYGKKFHLSYSAVQLIPNEQLSPDGLKQRDIQHYIIGGYKYAISPNLILEPTVLTKVTGTGTSFLGNVLVHYRQFWGGVGMGNQSQMAALLGMRITKLFHVGYSYDYSFSELGQYNQGSHEIVIGLNIPRFPASIMNVVE
jgi:type IX secretion system PorP/SprF family membrane protein